VEAVPGEGELTTRSRRARAGELHGLEPAGDADEAVWLEVERPAVVLGSSQRDEVVDVAACEESGIDVVRRRSGGGAVLMLPDEILWLDVVVRRGSPRWDDDISRSMWWLGEAWASALREVGVDEVVAHRGGGIETSWSRLICFDGIGAGEVTVAGRKAVGISQRRTRDWARLQSAVHLAWRPELLLSLLRGPKPLLWRLSEVWTLPPALTSDAVRSALADHL
jgi:lipoate-protein ligase A